ncbi:hypothetical protein A2999_00740 [Candidatus Wolfebacteria bacterium RIFCSPLOWO2_01_FULL_38_11]|uniref:Uncharacterized protein n=2 Tax=Candidatus Wolfeibacteriota TaxID=1752735 RepID=A0A1F8DST0_9BACT|nr:MAG: hypothetical protein A2999_00740 [Candidatus Wolfebacteria bacterium RIFCSPLOWO2_01_FULL_38_11]
MWKYWKIKKKIIMENSEIKDNKKLDYLLSTSILISSILIVGALVYGAGLKSANQDKIDSITKKLEINFEKEIISEEGYELPAKWGSLGKQLVEIGVIDANKFEMVYDSRGGLNDEDKKLLYGEDNGNLVIDKRNSGVILNLLWAFGLVNKNQILENGPMSDPQYGGAQNFASTGGWTLAQGGAMAHYSRHQLVVLTNDQQKLVEEVSKNIYRPCCGNSTYFPDCNHGMAMLGLLEIMASQGVSEEEMYRAALIVNSYWFPDTYLTIAKYFENRGVRWLEVNPKEVLGEAYSSALGYQKILESVEPQIQNNGGGCGI